MSSCFGRVISLSQRRMDQRRQYSKSSTKALTMEDLIDSTRENIRQRNLNSQSGMSDDLQSESVHQNDNHQQSSSSDDGNQRNASNKSGYFPSYYLWVFISCLMLLY